MKMVRHAKAIGSLLLLSALLACGGGEPTEEDSGDNTEIVNLTRTWSYLRGVELGEITIPGSPHHKAGFGVIISHEDNGLANYLPPGRGPQALAEVYSSDTGTTYGVRVDSPNPLELNDYSRQAAAVYEQYQFYRKTSAEAWVDLEVSGIKIEAVSGNPFKPTGCSADLIPGRDCWNGLVAWIEYDVVAIRVSDGKKLGFWNGRAELNGYQGSWAVTSAEDMYVLIGSLVWRRNDLELLDDVDGDGGYHAILQLTAPVSFRVPLDLVNEGETFYIRSNLAVATSNHMQGESGITAWFQDPAKSGGTNVVTHGVVPAPAPAVLPIEQPRPPVADCAGSTDPLAGQFELVAGPSSVNEGIPKNVRVLRKGGSKGAASVMLSTRDGTARAGVDYAPLGVVLEFGDGQAEDRVVTVVTHNDEELESDETFDLVLSDVRGCAALGSLTRNTVTILDKQTRNQAYTIGGTVSGLAGSGLVLRETLGGSANLSAANGPFTFTGGRSSGSAYEVRVETQPTNPIQICTVANGAGTIVNANVTNVAVTCATPAPNGSLDPSFGNGGKVASNIAFVTSAANARMGMALQADGRILLVGGLKLARFNSNGTPDTSFGTAGVVAVPFNGSAFDYAQGVAVQTDGRIVVVGTISVGGTAAEKQDFALARFNTDGTLDTSFGIGGMVTTDFKGNQDIARRIVIQSDGKLLVAGYSTFVQPPSVAFTSFALARYNVDGSPDTSFASGLGRTGGGFAGTINQAQGLTVQRDGKIVMAGKTASDAGSNPDAGLTRHLGVNAIVYGEFFSAGEYDHYFGPGPDPVVPGAIKGFGQVSSNLNLGGSEEAVDVVEQSGIDGQLLVASRSTLAGNTRFGLATFLNLTDPKSGKVYGGFYPTTAPHLPTLIDFSGKSDAPRAMALQADGKVLMVGMSDIFGANPDMAIARFSPSLQNASIDTTFGIDGKVSVDFFGAIDGAEAVAVQPDGRIIVGGFARNAGTTVFALVRLLP